MDPREIRAYLNATPQQIEVARRLLFEVLCCLQAQSWLYQGLGWLYGRGASVQAPVFEFLADSSRWESSEIARKIVGYFGPESLDFRSIPAVAQQFDAQWQAHSPDHLAQCLRSESDLQATLLRTVRGIKAVSAMTLGLDNALKVLADKHEGNVLALQQSNQVAKIASGTANHWFHDNPEKREVLQLVRGPLPPTPVEIKEGPGGEGISTLNRFVIDSKDPRIAPAGPENHIRQASSTPDNAS